MKKNNFSVRIAAITVIAAMGAGIAWIPARSVDRSSVAPQATTDTCNCYKATPAPPCNDSIKVIEWQGGTCVKTVTIYEDSVNNSSGASEFLALGTVNGYERRILLEVDLSGVRDSICRNPNLGKVAQFDSVRVTLYVVDTASCGQYRETGFIFRLGTITDANWEVDGNGSSLDACATLYSGVVATEDNAATWKRDNNAFVAGTPRNWPLSPGYDSVEFVCHRPMPDNPPMKDTIREWISGSSANYGWMIALDPALVETKQDYALVFYSSTYSEVDLRPKLTMYFTKGENRPDDPKGDCVKTYFIPAPR
jgi:hypothetical protein